MCIHSCMPHRGDQASHDPLDRSCQKVKRLDFYLLHSLKPTLLGLSSCFSGIVFLMIFMVEIGKLRRTIS